MPHDWDSAPPSDWFNPFNDAYIQDPYSVYDVLRRHAPVYRSDLGFTIITRYADVMGVLRSQAGSRELWKHSSAYRAARSVMTPTYEEWLRTQLQFLDPPDHTRQRALLSRAFTPKAIEGWRPRIRQIVNGLLNDVEGDERFDVLEVLAKPLPNRVIIEMLGLPTDDPRLAGDWTSRLVRGLSTIVTDEDLRDANDALLAAREVIEHSVAAHRVSRPDDLLTRMIEAEESGETLTTTELVSNVVMLFIAGSETTTNLIGNGMASLLQDGEQERLLRSQRGLMGSAVEEMLRLESPAQFQSRVLKEPLEIAGETIGAGELLYLGLGAANRDPARWQRPDQLDITRADAQHAAFGFGIHYCLGQALARCEAQESVAALLDLGALELDIEHLEWGGAASISQRGLKHLQVCRSAGAPKQHNN